MASRTISHLMAQLDEYIVDTQETQTWNTLKACIVGQIRIIAYAIDQSGTELEVPQEVLTSPRYVQGYTVRMRTDPDGHPVYVLALDVMDVP